MLVKRIIPVAFNLVLAMTSFAYARHRYVQRNSALLTNPFNAGESARVSNPFMERELIGDWVKDEWLFAIALPAALLAAGAALALKK